MKNSILVLILFLTSLSSSFSQEKPRQVEWNGKNYFVYPYRYDSSKDRYYSYDYQIGAAVDERDIVPYPGSLPDGDYIMYYDPISKWKKKMWFFHRRGEYYDDTTVVASTFSLKNNQKEGKAEFYDSFMGRIEFGNYTNNQKEGEWLRRGYRTFYSHMRLIGDNDEYAVESGQILELLIYKEGIREGKYRAYMTKDSDLTKITDKMDSANLFLFANGNYHLNKESGTWTYFYKNNKLFKKFSISDTVFPKNDEIVYSYNAPKILYHNWYEEYFPNGQLHNRILYKHGVKEQLDTGYFSNGKLCWTYSEEIIQEDTFEIKMTEYKTYDSLGYLLNHTLSKDWKRLWMKTYFENQLCSEYFDAEYYSDLKNKDTLVPSSIFYTCYNLKSPKEISEITFYHPETGIHMDRNLIYPQSGYYDENDDFVFKSDTASHIYYVTEINQKGKNKEFEYHTYKHYYRGPFFHVYGNYSSEDDSVVIFHNGKRFTGSFTEYYGRWKRKKMSKVKATDKSLKFYSYYYAGRSFGGTPSFGYNSKKLVVFERPYRRFSGRWKRKIVNTTKGNYVNGLKEGEWVNKNKRHGFVNDENNYSNGQLNGPQLYYLYEYADRWSECVDIVDKKISKKKGLFRKYRYYLSSKDNYQNDERNGKQYSYYCNGQLSQLSEYDGGIQTGNHEIYGAEGNMTKKTSFNHGFYDGKYQEWAFNKKLRYDLNFEEGLMVGEYKSYYFNGNPSLYGNLNNGYKIGEWITYFEEGEIKFKDIYTVDDSTFMGFFTYYSPGARQGENLLHNMNSCYSMQYYPSGTLAAEGRIKRNARTGIWKFFDEGGNLIRQINYEPGEIIEKNENGVNDTTKHFGYYESWYSNGKKQTEAYVLKESSKFDCYQEVTITLQDLYYLNYWDKENNQTIKDKTGRLKSYHLTTGRQESEGEMIDGKKTGYWRYWDPEGKLNSVGNYKNDLHEGRWLFGDLEGMHYLDDACFDISDPRVIEDMETKKKQLSITEIIYIKGELIKETRFSVDLNR